jgi:hypothetical protein
MGRKEDVTDLPFRIAVPVSIRTEQKKGEIGNEIMCWMLELPIDRDERVIDITGGSEGDAVINTAGAIET